MRPCLLLLALLSTTLLCSECSAERVAIPVTKTVMRSAKVCPICGKVHLAVASQSMQVQAVPLQAVPLQAVPLQAVPLQAVPLQAAPITATVAETVTIGIQATPIIRAPRKSRYALLAPMQATNAIKTDTVESEPILAPSP